MSSILGCTEDIEIKQNVRYHMFKDVVVHTLKKQTKDRVAVAIAIHQNKTYMNAEVEAHNARATANRAKIIVVKEYEVKLWA